MMLSEYEPTTESVPLPGKGGQSITVRGLSLEDLSFLVSSRLHDIEQIVTLFNRQKASVFSRSNLDGMILTMTREAPDLVAEVISRAAGEGETGVAGAKKLPFPVQVVILNKVVTLTLDESGGLKNLMAVLGTILKDMLPASVLQGPGSPTNNLPETK